MLDRKEFRGEMVRNGYTYETLAPELGMSVRTLKTRVKTGDFHTKEIEIIIALFQLSDPMRIFFAN